MKKIRYAVVGLGHIAQAAVLPAFEHAGENSVLAALVSDDPVKLQELGSRYGVVDTFMYDQFEGLLKSGLIDAVYIALPNSMHCDFSAQALCAGIHVLCEKPMAMTEADCLKMIDCAAGGNTKLMIAYRLHFEKGNLEAIETVKSGRIGSPRYFNSIFSLQVAPQNIRLNRELGGGALYDLGVYCVNAARYCFQQEPLEVFGYASSGADDRFTEVEEMVSATLFFPQGREASFICSFGAANVSAYDCVGTKGHLRVEPAYEYEGELKHRLTVDGKTEEKSFPRRDQFAAELIYFSRCILENKNPEPDGWEGLADIRVLNAITESAKSGKSVKLPPFVKTARPTMRQEIEKPPPEKEPNLVHAQQPTVD
jgi:predicted dehydrogenase